MSLLCLSGVLRRSPLGCRSSVDLSPCVSLSGHGGPGGFPFWLPGCASCLGRLDLTPGSGVVPLSPDTIVIGMCTVFSVRRTFVGPEVRTDLGGSSPVGDGHALAPARTDQQIWGLRGHPHPRRALGQEERPVCSRKTELWGVPCHWHLGEGAVKRRCPPWLPTLVCPTPEWQPDTVPGPN